MNSQESNESEVDVRACLVELRYAINNSSISWWTLTKGSSEPLTINGKPFFFRPSTLADDVLALSQREVADIEYIRRDQPVPVLEINQAILTIANRSVDENNDALHFIFLLDDFLALVDPDFHDAAFSEVALRFANQLNEVDFIFPYFAGHEQPFPQVDFTELLATIPGGRQALVSVVLESIARLIRESMFLTKIPEQGDETGCA